jgi:hypothetical protein
LGAFRAIGEEGATDAVDGVNGAACAAALMGVRLAASIDAVAIMVINFTIYSFNQCCRTGKSEEGCRSIWIDLFW